MQTHYAEEEEEELQKTQSEPLLKGLIETVGKLLLGIKKPVRLEADEKVPRIKTSTLEEVRQKLNIQRVGKASQGTIDERPKGFVDRGTVRKARTV